MNLLVYTDGSQAAEEAVRYAARRREPETDVCLLHVIPSGRQGAHESGERVLSRSRELFLALAGPDAPVSTRLEVGNAAVRIAEVADCVNADVIVMGSHGLDSLPRSQVLGQAAENTVAATSRPVILVFPKGSEVIPAAGIGV